MKITLYSLTQVVSIFQKILQTPFPAKQAFAISRLIKQLDAEMTNFNEFRSKVVEKYALRDERGQMVVKDNNIVLQEGKEQEFQQEMVELLNSQIEITAEPIPVEWLERDEVILTPGEINLMMPLLKE